jgi:sugar (pentulose or hexulose) kinase
MPAPYSGGGPPAEELHIARREVRIGIDAGTGELRAVAYRAADADVLAAATEAFPVVASGERRTVDFARIGRAQDAALATVLHALPADIVVTHVGVAATASTVGVVAEDGTPGSDGLLWADHRATREANAMRAAGHPNLDRMLGHVSPEWGIPKLAALARSGALDGRAVDRCVELADWLGHRLTGAWAANAGTREWGWAGGDDGTVPPPLLEAAGVDGRLAERVIPDVLRTGAPLATVRAPAGGLSALAGASVLVGGMDSYLAATGMGVAAEGRLCISIGSSSAAIAGSGCGDATGRMLGPLRTVLAGGDAAWHGGQTTAGLAVAWAARMLGAPSQVLEAEAAQVPPGAGGVTFRETLLDRRTPDPRSPMSGSWTGLRLDHTRGHLYRAALEGVAFGLAAACGSLDPHEVVISGGMTASPLFVQILADVLAAPVARLASTGSAAALGAAFADIPEDLARLVPIASVTRPSGADYAAAAARYLADCPSPSGE